MGPIVSIELLLDADSEERVREDWQRLASAGLSSMGASTAVSNRPHITLLVREQLPSLDVAGVLGGLPLRLTLADPTLFGTGDRRILVRGVALTPALLEVHRAVHAAAGPGQDAPHTRPGEWTPHVTLARRLRATEVPQALGLLAPPSEVVAVGMRRWDAATRTVTLLG
jgi:2'-5' RNA ligase